ncbi:XRE family transcriptional regulator (plasmid) [Fischerella sp. NIES-4106]|nr:XRE family transcriptional regulator [Fischerella sp. NIES-4106]
MINPANIDLKALPWLPLDEKTAFPQKPAIYFAIDSLGNIQYIGRTKNVRSRWGNHHKYEQLSTIGNIKIAYLFVDLPELLPQIETALIEYFDPPLNAIKPSLVPKKFKTKIRNRKVRVFRLDEIVIDGLNELARRKNSSANRLLENTLFELLKTEGIIEPDAEPLGETRGGDQKSDKSKEDDK